MMREEASWPNVLRRLGRLSLLHDDERLRATQGLVALALIAGVVLTIPLWLSDRDFPLFPRLSFVPALPPPLDRLALGALIALSLLIVIYGRAARWGFVGLALVIGLMVLIDQTRWQPWVYQYVVMLLLLIPWRRAEPAQFITTRLDAVRIMVASIYFWSGLQKVNLIFFADDGQWFLEPILTHLPNSIRSTVEVFRYLFPAVEFSVGVGLLVPRVRRSAVLVGLLIHVFILYALGPLGHNVNEAIWPWNVAMVGFLVILFAGDIHIDFGRLWSLRPALSRRAVLLAVLCLPALNFAGLWDSYMSWSLYSGMKLEGEVYIDDPALPCLPGAFRRHVKEAGDETNVLAVWQWGIDVLHVPPYPERWVFRRIRDQLCTCDPSGNLILFELWDPSRWRIPTIPEEYQCGEAW